MSELSSNAVNPTGKPACNSIRHIARFAGRPFRWSAVERGRRIGAPAVAAARLRLGWNAIRRLTPTAKRRRRCAAARLQRDSGCEVATQAGQRAKRASPGAQPTALFWPDILDCAAHVCVF